MIIRTYVTKPLDNNIYLLVDENTKDAVIIDASELTQEIVNDVKDLGANVKYILMTHGHFDHIMAVNEFVETFNTEALINDNDRFLVNNINSMFDMVGFPHAEKLPEITGSIEDGQEFSFGSHKIKAIAVAGHTEGGMAFLVDNEFLFSGDTLFRGTFGRTDFPGGNAQKIVNSLVDILFKLDDNIKVYPGHGKPTTIEYEKQNNEINSIL